MIIRWGFALALVAIIAPAGAWAQSDGEVDAKALEQTLGSMQGLSPNAAGSLDPRLGAIEQSPELRQEFNELTKAMMTEMVERSGGDPDKMNDEVERGRSDPAAFAEGFSPETRARLEALARKLEQ